MIVAMGASGRDAPPEPPLQADAADLEAATVPERPPLSSFSAERGFTDEGGPSQLPPWPDEGSALDEFPVGLIASKAPGSPAPDVARLPNRLPDDVTRSSRSPRGRLALLTTVLVLVFVVDRFDRAPGVDTLPGVLEGRPLASIAGLAPFVDGRAPAIAPTADSSSSTTEVVRPPPVEPPATARTHAALRQQRASTPVERSLSSRSASDSGPAPRRDLPAAAVAGRAAAPAADRPLAGPSAEIALAGLDGLAPGQSREEREETVTPADRRATAGTDASTMSDRQETDEILQAVKQFQIAYERLDPELTRAVWPTVDARALARAFDGLRSQRVAFERCQVTVDDDAGQALCWGTITYVPRVGSRFARTESRLWIFDLTNWNRRWLIANAVAR